MISRRNYLGGLIAASALVKARVSSALGLDPQDPHAGHVMSAPKPVPPPAKTPPPATEVVTRTKARRGSGYTGVVTPNGSTLPFTMKDGFKEFRLTPSHWFESSRRG